MRDLLGAVKHNATAARVVANSSQATAAGRSHLSSNTSHAHLCFEGEGGGEVEGAQVRDLALTAMVGGPVVEVLKDQQESERFRERVGRRGGEGEAQARDQEGEEPRQVAKPAQYVMPMTPPHAIFHHNGYISTSCVSQSDLMPMPAISARCQPHRRAGDEIHRSAERARFGAVGFLRIATTRGPPRVVNPGPRVDAIRRARPVVSSSSSSSKAPLGSERAANIHSYVLSVDPFTILSEPPLT
jgi:hypothetical protein